MRDKQCVVLLVHHGDSYYQMAPYLDVHGESDPGLRCGVCWTWAPEHDPAAGAEATDQAGDASG